ncbi:MAG: sugar phosphate nucleotidyltransferase [Bacteroidetes bacterium]|nr:sugar phosphate nucleotidyltransferase [Bacteroidota bacterium]MCL5034349.1 sugar phosphate nucleotidyltransferase [Bacteroidota bacterium]
MRALIPVAGVGTRLRPHTYTLPKVLLNVGGKPIVGHIVENLLSVGIKNISVVVGYMGDMVEDYLRSNYQADFEFVYQEERLGLGHATHVALSRDGSDEPLLIVLGDTVFDVDLSPLLESEYSSIGVKRVEDPRRFGVAETAGNRVKRLIEKPDNPTSNLAVVGLYYIKTPKALFAALQELIDKDIRTKGEYQLTDALQLMLDHGEVITYFEIDGWYDCGKPETLLETNRHLLKRTSCFKQRDNVVILPPVFIADSAVIKNSVIGPNATIDSAVTVTDSLIRDSIIGSGASIQNSLLEGSIVGQNAQLKGSFKRVNAGDSTEIDLS